MDNRVRHTLYAAKKRAKEKGIEFTLELSDIVIPTHCPVLGIPLEFQRGKPSDNSPSIDRIDNSKGYTPDNVVVISMRANQLKRDATLPELKALVEYMERHSTE